MDLRTFLDTLARLEEEGRTLVTSAQNTAELTNARNELAGRKNGRLTELMRAIPSIAKDDERKQAGREANRTKQIIEALLSEAESRVTRPASEARLDLTMPARRQWRGGRHPVTVVLSEIQEIFRELGFTVVSGPEVETPWYNFTSLNFPANHPAMDLHDTLYTTAGALLRTHTSPVQVRTLQKHPPPIRVLVPGNVYRRDFFDPSHAPMFAQLEGLAVDEGVSFVDLKATLNLFAQRFFGKTRTRFRPSYFPFTEPSAEMDVSCRLCGGDGCSGCKQTGWMEIMGAGMVHPHVLENAGVDSERYTGWAFGMGPARIAMQRYGIPDIRLLYDSDVRFLEQLAE